MNFNETGKKRKNCFDEVAQQLKCWTFSQEEATNHVLEGARSHQSTLQMPLGSSSLSFGSLY